MRSEFVISCLLTAVSRVLYFADNEKECLEIKSQLEFLTPNIKVIIFSGWDIQICSDLSPCAQASGSRIASLIDLWRYSKSSDSVIVLTTIEAAIQKTPPIDTLLRYFVTFREGDFCDRDNLIQSLIACGYTRADLASSAGEFAVRGGVFDIVNYQNLCYRLTFSFSTIESIKIVDLATQLSQSKADSVALYPVSEIILDQETLNCFQKLYLKNFGAKQDHAYHEVQQGLRFVGIERWLPLFYEKTQSFFDLLSEDWFVFQSHKILEKLNEVWFSIDRERNRTANNNRLALSYLYMLKEEFALNLKYLQNLDSETTVDLAPNLLIAAQINKIDLLSQIREYSKHNKICIACSSCENLEKISLILTNAGMRVFRISSSVEAANKGVVYITILKVSCNVIWRDLSVFQEELLLRDRFITDSKRRKRRDATKFFQELISIQPGDLVVHSEYGIGQFQGIKSIQIQSAQRDFIEIVYADSDKLYLPVENLEVISRYGEASEGVVLDKLGSNHWNTRKESLKEKVKMAAEALIKNAAERELQEGLILNKINEFYQKFVDRFPYVTTEDQENAIEDVLNDLSSGLPMDRLICADTGFGKTEVALRAACVATLGSYPVQVAVIVPTTLLARQHLATFQSRFKDFPVKINALSKFSSRKEAAQIKEEMEKGTLDIVVGTHSLLANDMKFKNLGLIIVDEEQHFGVAQKEKLKNLRCNAHVLTLSATPIPRTLQMALVSIKSLSLITTPPINRRPVRAVTMHNDPNVLREALLREKERRGLSFYVTPRISYLDEIERNLNLIVPELKVARVHGGLASAKLDQVMNDFYDHKFDVLLSTSIIESGLDIASANTIIVDRAHMFGLSQLYQMRGRVGRGEASSFAYFLTPRVSVLSVAAKKKLEMLQSLQKLGAGFCVASYDMDARGYGNLLGEEQSGHMRAVGVELYQKMLADAIAALGKKESDFALEWSPSINLGLSVKIPESYIEEDALRLSLYRQIAAINDEAEIDAFSKEMEDRFGKLCDEIRCLFEVIKLKVQAKALNISKIDAGDNGLVLAFKDNQVLNHQNLLLLMTSEKEFEVKLRPDGKVLFSLKKNIKTYDKLATLKRILLQLAEGC